MSDHDASDSDAPEEFTAEEGLQLEQGIIQIQKDSTKRAKQEGKARRKKWTERKASKPGLVQEEKKKVFEKQQLEEDERSNDPGMLSKDIVNFLAGREKQVFSSDSEEEDNILTKRQGKKKRAKQNGPEAIILNDLPPPPCLQNSLDFLKKRKMQVPRSNAVLNNSKQALRLMTSSGLLK